MAHTNNVNYRQASIKSIWKSFWIVLIVTMEAVGLAFGHLYTGFPCKLLLNSIFIGLTIVKAFFIVAEFMHLGHEVRNLIMTILFPLTLFVWFIIAFLADGDSWKNMRKDLSPGTPVKKETPAQAPAHH